MSKIYVTPHINDWAVKQEGIKALISVHNTEEEAIVAAKKVAYGRNAEIVQNSLQLMIKETEYNMIKVFMFYC